jgi:MFS family permease
MQRRADMKDRAAWSTRARNWLSSPTGTAVFAIGFGQILAWGTTLYALGVGAAPIIAETGWSRSLVYGGLTVGLLASGILSTPMGRLFDRHGARGIMTGGSLLAAACLTALAYVRDPWTYMALWAVLGIAMRATLYDAAFAAMVQVTPANGRRAISYLTLFGGFASTVFWPIGYMLVEAIGWRGMFLVFAAINVLFTAPLNWFGLARKEPSPEARDVQPNAAGATAGSGEASPLTVAERRIAMGLFGIVMAASAFIFGAMAVHLPALLEGQGLTATAAVTLASLKGFAQVGGRVWELIWGQRQSPLIVGRVAMVAMPVAFALLLAGGANFTTALVFIVVFGVANGLVTIVRGTVPLYLFGPAGYATVLGILATPYLLTNATAPMVFAWIVDWGGLRLAEFVLLGFGLLAAVALEVLRIWHEARQSRPT